jgi:hypothetical protein
MTLRSRFILILRILVMAGWTIPAWADDGVTVVSSGETAPASAKKSGETNSDGSPVVHKSSHRKKSAQVAAAGANSATTNHTATGFASTLPRQVQYPPVERPLPPAPANMLPVRQAAETASAGTTAPTAKGGGSAHPAVETGLPVARYTGIPAPIPGVSTYQAPHRAYLPNNMPATLAASEIANYTVPNRPPPPPLSDFNFVNPVKPYHNTYQWKSQITTTEFWIGEGSTPISSTTNVESSWDEDWLEKNHGTDSPNNRNGYASGSHASTLNPFYCALPFNDLAFPDKARMWLPRGWFRHSVDGKQVSACQHRWVEIKNSRGDICYAQWEDTGPLRYDDAEYVFGSSRPTGLGGDHAGLDVSPAVYEYLDLNDRNHYTSWRFVDEADVRPGAWLKLDEQAVIFTALEQLKNRPLAPAPIQRGSEPIADPSFDSNKKKVDRAN